MGNDPSRKAFKGTGHTLSGKTVSGDDGAKSTNASAGQSKGSSAKAALRGLQGPWNSRKPAPSKVPSNLTEAQLEEHRLRVQQAAENRGKEWETRLAKQRAKRAQARKAEAPIDMGKGTASSSQAETLKSIDSSKVFEALDKEASKLSESGFNPYEANFSGSTQARSALLFQEEGSGASDTSQACSPSPAPQLQPLHQGQRHESKIGETGAIRATAQDEEQQEREVVSQNLAIAVSACDMDALAPAIRKAEAILRVKPSEPLRLLLLDAKELHNALQISVEQSEAAYAAPPAASNPAQVAQEAGSEDQLSELFSPEAVVRLSGAMDLLIANATVDGENTKASIKTILKLLDNIKENPSEEKFRRLKLSNKTIQAKIINFAQGAPVTLLQELGFVQQENEEDGPVLRLEDAALPTFDTKYSATRSSLSDLLSQLG